MVAFFIAFASNVDVVFVGLSPCSCSSWWRNEVVRALRRDLDSAGVRGNFGCVKSRRLAAIEAAGRTRRWGVGWSMLALCGVGVG